MDDTLDNLISRRTLNVFHVAKDVEPAFQKLGLTSMDAVFAFEAGRDLAKPSLASYRRRVQFDAGDPLRTLFMKRYDHPPVQVQIRNWLGAHKRVSCAMKELQVLISLSRHGVGAPRPVACGQVWAGGFERRSFLVTEKIADARSLEQHVPPCFEEPASPGNLQKQRQFIRHLARFIRRFHDLGYRHRDLYLAHIFRDPEDRLFLIDLARASRPVLLRRRLLVKDLAQVHYSMPARHFTRTDRLRFWLAYRGRNRLTRRDKWLIRWITAKARRMARHTMKHGATAPFLHAAQSLTA